MPQTIPSQRAGSVMTYVPKVRDESRIPGVVNYDLGSGAWLPYIHFLHRAGFDSKWRSEPISLLKLGGLLVCIVTLQIYDPSMIMLLARRSNGSLQASIGPTWAYRKNQGLQPHAKPQHSSSYSVGYPGPPTECTEVQ